MAAYATVTWQPGDEVTSQKLQQMASNEQWIKDNMVPMNVNFPQNAQGSVAHGRTKGTLQATKAEVVVWAYDSQVPVKYHDFTVKLPPVFTTTPVIVYSNYNTFNDAGLRMFLQNGAKEAKFRVWDTLGRTQRQAGEVSVLLVGK